MAAILSGILSALGALLRAIPAAWGWCKRHPVATPWILCGVLAGLLAWSAWSRPAVAPQGNAAEAAHVAAAGGVVVQPVDARALEEREATLLKEIAELRAGKEAALAEVGRLTVVAVLQGKSKPAPAHGKVRPGEPAACPEQAKAPPVLLRDGDKLVLSLDGLAYRAPGGTEFLLVPVGVTRDSDGELLQRELLSVPWTEAARRADPVPPAPRVLRLGVAGGGVAGGGGASWLVGGQALYREHLTLTVVGGPGSDRKGVGVALFGVVF